MAPGKEKNNSSKSTSKLPGCTTTHKDYQTIVDFITEIYLRTGNCTPSQLQTQHPKHYQKFNTDSLKGLIYRTKNKLRNNYNFAAGTATPTKAATDNKDTKTSANSNLEESSDEEESDDELEASDIDSEENFSSDEEESDSDISMGSGSSSKREQRKKKSSKFQMFLILSSLKISI